MTIYCTGYYLTMQVILNHLRFEMSLSSAIFHPRLHNQLYPNYTMVEEDETYQFQKDILDALEKKGHMIEKGPYSVVQGIVRSRMAIQATSDPRKGGKPDGF